MAIRPVSNRSPVVTSYDGSNSGGPVIVPTGPDSMLYTAASSFEPAPEGFPVGSGGSGGGNYPVVAETTETTSRVSRVLSSVRAFFGLGG